MNGNAVELSVFASNNDASAHKVEVRYLLDTQIDINDGSPLYAPTVGTKVYETDIPIINFSTWEAWLTPEGPTMKGIGTLSDTPYRMVLAWWPNAFSYPWDYIPNPEQRFYTTGYSTSPYSDSCVLLYFNIGSVMPYSCTLPVKTYYGIGTPGQGPSGDRLKKALEEFFNAVSDYIIETSKLYAVSVAPGYKQIIEDMTIQAIAVDLTKQLLSGDDFPYYRKVCIKGCYQGIRFSA